MKGKKVLIYFGLSIILVTALFLNKEWLDDKLFGTNIDLQAKEETESKHSMPILSLSPFPYKKDSFVDASVNAKSVKIIDLKTNATLLEKNPDEKLEIASLTKIMTALIVMENSNRNDVVTVQNVTTATGEAEIGLTIGEKIKAGELLKALLIHSAGDAASALATHIGGSETSFIEMMNQKATDLEFTDTHFANVRGIDNPDNYSTTSDLLNLTRIVLNNAYFNEVISTTKYTATNETGKTYNLKTTNKILDNEKVFGVKTGYTYSAGECLITLAKDGDNEILIVVLGSTDRFGETSKLIDWAFENYGW